MRVPSSWPAGTNRHRQDGPRRHVGGRRHPESPGNRTPSHRRRRDYAPRDGRNTMACSVRRSWPTDQPLRSLATLFEPHLAEIDCDHQHFRDRPTIGSARVGAPLGRQTYAVRHHIIRSQLRRFKTACDIHAIVMAAEPQILAEEKILNEAVRLDRTRKVCAQNPPRLRAFPPALCFHDLHAIHREKKWRGEIGPYGFAIEIGTMERVPRRVHLVARERVLRRTALRNYCSIKLLDGNPIWREHRALIGSPVRPD